MNKKHLFRLMAALATLLLLAGCISIKEELTINPDNTAQVKIDYGFSPEFTEYMQNMGEAFQATPQPGQPAVDPTQDMYRDMFKDIEGNPNITDFKSSQYSKDDMQHVVAEFKVLDFMSFANQRAADSSSGEQGSAPGSGDMTYSLTQEGENFRYLVHMGTGGEDMSMIPSGSFKDLYFDMIITVPTLVETNGEKKGNTASWHIPMEDLVSGKAPTDLFVVYNNQASGGLLSGLSGALPSIGQDGGGDDNTTLYIIIGLSLCCCLVFLVVVVVVVVLLVRRKKARAQVSFGNPPIGMD